MSWRFRILFPPKSTKVRMLNLQFSSYLCPFVPRWTIYLSYVTFDDVFEKIFAQFFQADRISVGMRVAIFFSNLYLLLDCVVLLFFVQCRKSTVVCSSTFILFVPSLSWLWKNEIQGGWSGRRNVWFWKIQSWNLHFYAEV